LLTIYQSGEVTGDRLIYRFSPGDQKISEGVYTVSQVALLVLLRIDVYRPVKCPVSLLGVGTGTAGNLYHHVPHSDRYAAIAVLSEPIIHAAN